MTLLVTVVMLAGFQSQVVATGQAFTCTPTRVQDGEGPIWLAEGPRIRLAGINAREMDRSCLVFGVLAMESEPVASRL